MTSPLLLAIDGGGTKTDACIAKLDGSKQPEVIGRAQGGPANLNLLGADEVIHHLKPIIDRAAAAAGLSNPQFDRMIVALAGGGSSKQCEQVEKGLVALSCDSVQVVSDAELILAIAEALAPEDCAAVAIIVGTGSVAFGRDPKSLDLKRAGGWGPVIGDDGSGFWIGRAALRSILQSSDDQQPMSDMAKAFSDALAANTARELVTKVHQGGQPATVLASLAPLVINAAEAGDAEARQILVEAAICIGILIGQISDKLEQPPENTVVACGGSIITKQTILTERVEEFVKTNGTRELYFIEDPVTAAIQLAASPRFGL